MNAMNNASANASANVNGINVDAKARIEERKAANASAASWRRSAAAMLGHSSKAAYAGCRFIGAAVNRAISEKNRDAIDWLEKAAGSKTAVTRQTAKTCIRIITALLYGRQEMEKKGLTVEDAPAVEDWTVDSISAAAASHNWQERKGQILSLWTGKAPIRIERSQTSKTPAERLEALAKSMAALMVKNGFTMEQVTSAISDAKAIALAK